MLLPYRAKAREYNHVTVKEILDDQLAGTPNKVSTVKKRIDLIQCRSRG
jgi:hypothetical protein